MKQILFRLLNQARIFEYSVLFYSAESDPSANTPRSSSKKAVWIVCSCAMLLFFVSCSGLTSRMKDLSNTSAFRKFCGCPPSKLGEPPAGGSREEALGRLEEGALDELGTPNYLEKVYSGIKADFEYSGTKFDSVADGLETKGIALKRITDENKKLREILLLIDGDVSFPSGKATLTPAARLLIEKIADAMNAYPETKVRVGGHTDSVGYFYANLTLSKARANSVKSELSRKHNLPESRFGEVDGYADKFKIVDTMLAEPRNRRTEIYVGTVKLVL
ncbi:OmpA family protein [Leptospira ellisii]|uniref:OmpA family protein n=3 Tax=Leptospira ellisii TaxID=2023197 RepID=A0AAE4TYV3_9LEPT|nr:OmpA family protein [Leptospira ellisii]MDV6235717.1 OmpA family protein [Leptospira ellisii]